MEEIRKNCEVERVDVLQPFLKWAGGKRWFVSSYSYLLPTNFNRYVEPFLGSGAVFFYLCPKHALLADANRELIEAYTAIKADWVSVQSTLKSHQARHSDDHYYRMRSTQPKLPHTRAARFLYLNRTCWNGLYRVNRQGKFNVPKGTKSTVLQVADDFAAWSTALRAAKLRCADFEVTIDTAGSGDFVFCDPPYTVSHNKNGFIKYNQKIFSWEDQVRLRNALARLDKRGGRFAITNGMHESIRELYRGFQQIELQRSSIISGEPKGRRRTSELFIRNF
ncbi:MAG: DNA adenine methylase [Rhodanobacteraceae bacterium]